MSKLYSQQEISEMLKELQIEKEKAQNMAEAYYRMNAIAYDLNLHINEMNKQLESYKKAFELMAKDYCDCMGCAFCDHRAKCLEANHFKNLEGKEFLQDLFINEAREK